MRRTLRSRLLASFVIVATGVLLFAAAATWLLVRGSAQRIARDELAERATRLQALTADLNKAIASADAGGDARTNARLLQNSLVQIARGLQVTGARLVFIERSSGEILTGDDLERVSTSLSRRDPELVELITLPDGVTAGDLDTATLLAGAPIAGSHGTLVYRAEVLTSSDTRAVPAANVPLLVLTQRADVEAQRRVLTTFVFAAGVALVLCALVSAWLARRFTRPLGAVSATAAAIAGGDLSARVPADAGAESELATLTSTINRMAADLERARGAERAFLMSVSHDLRTPLTSIRGYAEALADGTLDASDTEARARAAHVIASEARRLERLVRDLLDLGRLDRREFSLHPRPCDAAAVVRDAALGFAPHAHELGLTIDVDASTAIAADLDPERLGQIVANLTENALKFATTRVEIDATTVDSTVVVSVFDDGPGIPEPEQTRVFDRLQTGRSGPAGSGPGRAVGTGLGLAIVRELAHAMGGDVRVEAPAGGGTRFVVRLHTPPRTLER